MNVLGEGKEDITDIDRLSEGKEDITDIDRLRREKRTSLISTV
jgi:hypothetical protein